MYCTHSGLRRVCAEGASFILVMAECPHFQSSVACATGIFDDQTRSRGYKQPREGGEATRSLFGVEVELGSCWVESYLSLGLAGLRPPRSRRCSSSYSLVRHGVRPSRCVSERTKLHCLGSTPAFYRPREGSTNNGFPRKEP